MYANYRWQKGVLKWCLLSFPVFLFSYLRLRNWTDVMKLYWAPYCNSCCSDLSLKCFRWVHILRLPDRWLLKMPTFSIAGQVTWIISRDLSGFLHPHRRTHLPYPHRRWPMADDFSAVDDKVAFVCRHLSLRAEQLSLVEVATRGQRDNPNWAAYRQDRFASSNFGSVLQCLSSGRGPSQSLMKTLVACRSVGGGGGGVRVQHEAKAIDVYEISDWECRSYIQWLLDFCKRSCWCFTGRICWQHKDCWSEVPVFGQVCSFSRTSCRSQGFLPGSEWPASVSSCCARAVFIRWTVLSKLEQSWVQIFPRNARCTASDGQGSVWPCWVRQRLLSSLLWEVKTGLTTSPFSQHSRLSIYNASLSSEPIVMSIAHLLIIGLPRPRVLG